ncbi:MAG: hypothetical protein AABX29_05850 [Nanoarchaeota archaeon]
MEMREGLGGGSILVKNFEAIRTKPIAEAIPTKPNPLFQSQEGLASLFVEVITTWSHIFDPANIRSLLTTPSEQSFLQLKKVRRIASILTDHFRLLGENHSVPVNLDSFRYTLGKHNDIYDSSKRQKYVDKLLQGDLIDSLSDIERFTPTSVEDFQGYITNLFDEINYLSSQPELIVDKFHGLRIKVRQIANLLQIPAAQNLQGEAHWLFFQFFNITENLGSKHDEGKKFHSKFLEVKPQIKKDIDSALGHFKTIIGLN